MVKDKDMFLYFLVTNVIILVLTAGEGMLFAHTYAGAYITVLINLLLTLIAVAAMFMIGKADLSLYIIGICTYALSATLTQGLMLDKNSKVFDVQRGDCIYWTVIAVCVIYRVFKLSRQKFRK